MVGYGDPVRGGCCGPSAKGTVVDGSVIGASVVNSMSDAVWCTGSCPMCSGCGSDGPGYICTN